MLDRLKALIRERHQKVFKKAITQGICNWKLLITLLAIVLTILRGYGHHIVADPQRYYHTLTALMVFVYSLAMYAWSRETKRNLLNTLLTDFLAGWCGFCFGDVVDELRGINETFNFIEIAIFVLWSLYLTTRFKTWQRMLKSIRR